MDVEDILRRVLLAYWPVILLLVAAGIIAPGLYHVRDVPTYTSQVRFTIDVNDPQLVTESTAAADTVRSIATSPSHVQNALDVAGVKRDATAFAARNVEVQSLGSSGVMALEVKDTDRYAAATIANALAADVIATRLQISRTAAEQTIDSLTTQINALDTRIAQLDAQTANFRAYPTDELNGLYAERNAFAQERLVLETQRAQIIQALALRPQGGIIDVAQPARSADASRAPVDIALGGLGGLVLGVLLAALLATYRPRISGRHGMEAALGGPVLGDAGDWERADGPALSTKIRLAAKRAGVSRLHLAALSSAPETEALVKIATERLSQDASAALPDPGAHHVGGRHQAARHGAGHRQLVVKPLDLSVLSSNGDGAETGLLLVTPNVLDRKAVETSAELVGLTGWPVAGIVTYGDAAVANPIWKAPFEYVRKRMPWRSR